MPHCTVWNLEEASGSTEYTLILTASVVLSAEVFLNFTEQSLKLT